MIDRAHVYAADYTINGDDWRDRTLAQSLEDAAEMRAGAEQLLVYRVAHARHAGMSWQQIGDGLGISKQAAQQRYGASSAALNKA